MKGFGARRIRVKIAEVWQTPALQVLLTHEDDVVVARCLDFTVSSHGENEREALTSLAEAIKEYVLTAIESNAVDAIFDPAQGRYWRMFNEIEAKRSVSEFDGGIFREGNVHIGYSPKLDVSSCGNTVLMESIASFR